MKDWKTLLTTRSFRSFWLALVCYNFGNWCVVATLPILVAVRFGAGTELVISLGMRILPRIALAPLAGVVLRRAGAARVAGSAMVAMGVLTAMLPWCATFVLLQAVILAIGVLDVFVGPALLTLRSPVTPRGAEMASNTLFFSADRLAKFAGPAIGGLAVTAGFKIPYLAIAGLTILAAIPIARIRLPATADRTTAASGNHILAVFREFRDMLRDDAILVAILVCAVPYMVTLGGMRPFLFWANAEWFGATDAAWTMLLTAQGVGAVAGALVSGVFSRSLLRAMSVYELLLVTSLMEGVLHIALLFAASTTQAMVLLLLSGIPEMLAYATYFTLVQERLPHERQGVFYSIQQALLDGAFVLGVAAAELHAGGVLTLTGYWATLSLFSTLPVLPLLAAHLRAGRVVVQPRTPAR
jgi:MFS family permease